MTSALGTSGVSRSWVAMGRVTDHRGHVRLEWLAAANHSGGVVQEILPVIMVTAGWECGWLGGGREGLSCSQCQSALGHSARLPISIWLRRPLPWRIARCLQ